jgi:hypothetical protein
MKPGSHRFGQTLKSYRRGSRPWSFTLRPVVSEEATLLIAYSCRACSSVGRWFVARHPVGLRIAPAEDSSDPELLRATYLPAHGNPSRGVVAIGHALAHIHIGWAIAGWVLTLPVLSHIAQIVVDVLGPGPRKVSGLPYDACALDPPKEH